MENKKLFQTLCLGAAVLSTGVPATAGDYDVDTKTLTENAKVTSPITINNETSSIYGEDKYIYNYYYKGGIEINDIGGENAAVDVSNSAGEGQEVYLLGDVIIKNIPAGNYALYAENSSAYSTIFVNSDNSDNYNNTVQITGDIKVGTNGAIKLNLNNSESYLAGKIEFDGDRP